MVVGPPELDTSKVGALVSFEHMNKVTYFLKKFPSNTRLTLIFLRPIFHVVSMICEILI